MSHFLNVLISRSKSSFYSSWRLLKTWIGMSFISHAGTFLVMKQAGGSWFWGQLHSRIWRLDGLAKPILTQISLFSKATFNMRAWNRRCNGYFMYFSPGFRSAACTPSIAPPIRPTPSSSPSPNSSWIWRWVPPDSRLQTCLKKAEKLKIHTISSSLRILISLSHGVAAAGRAGR